MKPTKCELVLNTRWGYVLQPIKCKSIAAALRIAKDMGMPYRIFAGNKLIRSGWIVS